MQSTTSEPKLAAPGAGLPFPEWAIARYVLFPLLCMTTSKSKAIESFARESQRILSKAKQLSPEQLGDRRLIPRPRGLEDSSRYWSVAMVLQHLVVVGNLIRKTATAIASGRTDLPKIG